VWTRGETCLRRCTIRFVWTDHRRTTDALAVPPRFSATLRVALRGGEGPRRLKERALSGSITTRPAARFIEASQVCSFSRLRLSGATNGNGRKGSEFWEIVDRGSLTFGRTTS